MLYTGVSKTYFAISSRTFCFAYSFCFLYTALSRSSSCTSSSFCFFVRSYPAIIFHSFQQRFQRYLHPPSTHFRYLYFFHLFSTLPALPALSALPPVLAVLLSALAAACFCCSSLFYSTLASALTSSPISASHRSLLSCASAVLVASLPDLVSVLPALQIFPQHFFVSFFKKTWAQI